MEFLIKKKPNELITPESINFTELIKNSNTITELNLQSEIINILMEEFTEPQQQLYLANLYMYLKFHPTNDFPINLENVFGMIGFANKGNAKKTLESNFTINEDYKITLVNTQKRKNEGGFNKENIMLNIETMKSLCMIAKTSQGKEMRKYYMKLENIHNKIIKKEIENTKILLQEKDNQLLIKETNIEELENTVDEFLDNQDYNDKIKRHNFILEKFKNKKCVYVCSILNFTKVGSTDNLEVRQVGLKREFGYNALFLDAFECEYFRDIEKNILVKIDKYKEPLDNNHTSRELVLLNDKFNYNQLIQIVKDEIKNYPYLTQKQKYDYELLEYNNKLLQYNSEQLTLLNKFMDNGFTYEQIMNIQLQRQRQQQEIPPQQIQPQQPQQIQEIQEIKPQQPILVQPQPIPPQPILQQPQEIQQLFAKGRKIQKIDPNNLNNIDKVYPSMIYALRDNDTFEKQSIQKAIKNNTLYKGYRWLFVENGKDFNVVNNIQPTTLSKDPDTECIVQLNQNETEIIDTFSGVNSFKRKYQVGNQRIRSLVNNHTLYDDSYFIKLSDCKKELLDNYTKPIDTRTSKKAKVIKQINQSTQEIVLYKSITEASIKCGFTNKTLTQSIKDKTLLKGYKWEYA